MDQWIRAWGFHTHSPYCSGGQRFGSQPRHYSRSRFQANQATGKVFFPPKVTPSSPIVITTEVDTWWLCPIGNSQGSLPQTSTTRSTPYLTAKKWHAPNTPFPQIFFRGEPLTLPANGDGPLLCQCDYHYPMASPSLYPSIYTSLQQR